MRCPLFHILTVAACLVPSCAPSVPILVRPVAEFEQAQPQAPKERAGSVHRLRFSGPYPYVTFTTSEGQSVNLLLDTGATGTLLAADAMDCVGERRANGKAIANFDWGSVECDTVAISDLKWDDDQYKNVAVTVIERSRHRFLERYGLDGILGYDFFSGKTLTIDYWRMEVTLGATPRQAAEEEVGTPFELQRQEILLEGEVAGLRGNFLVDTGTGRVLLDPEFCARAGILPASEARKADDQSEPEARVAKIRVGPFEATQFPVVLKRPFAKTPGVVGVVGNHLLGRTGRMSIDYAAKRLRFQYSSRDALQKGMEERASAGESWAQFGMYQLVRSTSQDLPAAQEWLKKAAAGGFSDAQRVLGDDHLRGRSGIAKDPAEALRWLEKASRQGDPGATWSLGVIYLDGMGVPQNPAKALAYLIQASRAGSVEAQADLGWCYAFGASSVRDETRGFRWLLRAAQRSNPDAQCNLGVCYERGTGVSKDAREAFMWYERSARSGITSAMFNLGEYLRKGVGGAEDIPRALEWYRKAASQGHAGAKKWVAELGGKE